MSAVRADVPIRLGPFLSIHMNVESAVEAETSFNNVCDAGHDPIKVKAPMTCPTCSSTSGFKKGREVAGKMVVLTPEELAGAEVDEDVKKSLSLTIHPRDSVDSSTIASAAAYFLTPGKSCQPGAYGLLRALIRANPDKVFCTVFAAKGKPAMYQLGAYGEVITLQKLAWPGDLKAVPEVPVDYDEAFLAMAQTLVDQLTMEFDASTYKDTQREQREALVAAKVDGAPLAQAAPEAIPSNVSNGLLAALQASVEATATAKKPKARKSA